MEKSSLTTNTEASEGGVDLRALWAQVLRRKWVLLITVTAVVGAVMFHTLRLPPIYRATATAIIDVEAPQVLGREVQEVVNLGTQGGYFDTREYLLTQYRIVQSTTLARRVVDSLKLHQDTTFLASGPGQKAAPTDPDRAARKLQSMVIVEPMRDTRILKVSIEHWDPKTAARLTNAITTEYSNFNIDQKVSATGTAVRWLTGQIDEVQQKLHQAEGDLHTFKQTNNIISVSLEDSQNLLMSQIKFINDKHTETMTRRIALDSRRKAYIALRNQKADLSSFPGLEEERDLALFKKSFDDEKRQLVELQERYHAKHPAVEAQQAKLSAAAAVLEREVDTRIKSSDAEFRIILDTERELNKALEAVKQSALALNKKEVDFNRLKREQENTSKVYAMLLSRLKESEISGQLRVNNIRVLDPPRIPESPVRPRKFVAFVLALLGGLGLGIFLGLVIDRLDDSVKSPEGLEQVTGTPLLGVFPRIRNNAKDVVEAGLMQREPALHVHYMAKSSAAECFRSIRTNLLFASVSRPIRRLLVASAVPREGKTTIAIGLGISLAQSGRRVVVVDADLRRPRVHEPFELSHNIGLTNVLVGESKLQDVIIQTEVERLSILACGPLPPNPAELLHSERFTAVLNQLSELYDFVIVDSPPVTAVADGLIAGSNCDGAIIVARMRESSLTALRKAARQLRSVNIPLLGCILNDLDFDRHRYGSHYHYGYYNYSYGSDREKKQKNLGAKGGPAGSDPKISSADVS